MATIAKNFDPVNYITKTQTINLTAGSSYTLGTAYNGGTAVDVFVSTDFVVTVGGVTKTKDIDYTLTGIDTVYTNDYGSTFFTQIKSTTITGSAVISYRQHGTYTDAGIINAHETRLNGHDTTLTSHANTLTSHVSRMDNIDATNTRQDDEIEDLQNDLAAEITARTDADTTEASARYSADTTLQGNLNTHTANTTDAHGATSAPTANTIIARDADGRAQVADPLVNNDIANKSYVDIKVVSAGGGDVSSAVSSSTSGNIVTMSGTTGKIIEDSGVAPSDLYASRCATQSVTTADVTITENRDGTLILSGALTGNRIVYLPAAVWHKTIICDCTGSYYIRVLAVGQTAGGVYIAPGDIANVYCNGTDIKPVQFMQPSPLKVTASIAAGSSEAIMTLSSPVNDALSEISGNTVVLKNTARYAIHAAIGVGLGGQSTGLLVIRVFAGGEQVQAIAADSSGSNSIISAIGEVLTPVLAAGTVLTIVATCSGALPASGTIRFTRC